MPIWKYHFLWNMVFQHEPWRIIYNWNVNIQEVQMYITLFFLYSSLIVHFCFLIAVYVSECRFLFKRWLRNLCVLWHIGLITRCALCNTILWNIVKVSDNAFFLAESHFLNQNTFSWDFFPIYLQAERQASTLNTLIASLLSVSDNIT